MEKVFHIDPASFTGRIFICNRLHFELFLIFTENGNDCVESCCFSGSDHT